MKKILLPTVMMFTLMIPSDSFAQFNKGRYLVGGTVAFSATTSKSDDGSTTTTLSKSNSFGLSPSVGYFFIDNLAAGAQLNASTSKSTSETFNFESTSTSLTFGPFVRYYLPVSAFFQVTTGFGSRKSEVIAPTSQEFKYSLFNWGLAAGYAYFFNDYVALEPMFGYQANIETNKSNDNKGMNGTLYLSGALTVYLGERR